MGKCKKCLRKRICKYEGIVLNMNIPVLEVPYDLIEDTEAFSVWAFITPYKFFRVKSRGKMYYEVFKKGYDISIKCLNPMDFVQIYIPIK